MTIRGRARRDLEDFVLVCGDRLQRTAHLMTGDPDVAEWLLQDALARASLDWRHLHEQPEPSVRRILVDRYVTWWRRFPAPPPGAPLAGLSRRQRTLVVLRVVDDLDEEDAADLLGWSVTTVRARTQRALADLGADPQVDGDLRAALTAHAGQVEPTAQRERLAGVHERAAVLARRRSARRTVLGTLGATTLVAAVVLVPPPRAGGGPDLPEPSPDNEQPVIDPPPPLVGYTLPPTVTQQGVAYAYARSEETPQGRGLLRVAVAPQKRPATVVWATSRGAGGSMVLGVDGDRVQTDPGGRLRSGLVLSKGRAHLVTIRHIGASENSRIGFALYTWPDQPE